MRNAQKVLEWAGSARDAWASRDAQFIRRQAIRILAYLDGTVPTPNGVPLVYRDVPAGTPLGVPENLAKVPLIETVPGQEQLEVSQEAMQTYLFRIDFQFITLSQSPGIRPETRQNALQIEKELKSLKTKFLAVHDDAKQIFNMTDAQLLQQDALSILDHMQTQANYAFTGQFDPSTGTVQPGVIQIHYQTQQLATFVIQRYKSH